MPDASGFVGFASGLTAEGSAPQPYDIAVDIAYQAEAVGALPAPVAASTLVRPTATTSGVAFAANTDATGSAVATVLTEDAPAPADPVGMFNMGTARNEGVGFPAVAPGDGVTEQITISGVHLVAGSAPDGSRFTDVDRQGDAAPATPAGPYTVGTARAEGAGFPAVVAGQAVAGQSTVSGLHLLAVSAPDGSRFADVDAEDDVAPADPRGTYGLGIAQVEGGAGAGVIAGDAVARRFSTSGVPYFTQAAQDISRLTDVDRQGDAAPATPAGPYKMRTARDEGVGFPAVVAGQAVGEQSTVSGIQLVALSAPDGSRFQDTDAENEPAPAAPRGGYVGGRATAALVALANGDYAVLNFDLAGLLRTVQPTPGLGRDAVHVTATSAALAAGANTIPVYTVPASRFHKAHVLMAQYNGAVPGLATFQARVGGVAVGLAQSGLANGVPVELFRGEVDADTAEVAAVQVENATAGDTITYFYHGVDEVTA